MQEPIYINSGKYKFLEALDFVPKTNHAQYIHVEIKQDPAPSLQS